MKKTRSIAVIMLVLAMMLTACTGGNSNEGVSTNNTSAESSTSQASTSTETSTETNETTEPAELAWNEAPENGVGKWKGYYTSESSLLNQLNYTLSIDNKLMSWFNGRLYRYLPNEDGTSYKVMPSLAESMPEDVNGDGLTWDIKVRDGLTWSNGEPLTASDFEFTFKQLYDPKQLNSRTLVFDRYFKLVNGEEYYTQTEDAPVNWEDVGVKIVDGNTLRFTLKVKVDANSIVNSLSSIYSAPVYPELYSSLMSEDGTETTYGTSIDRVMSSGMFTITEWNKDSNRKLVKNPNHPLADYVWWSEIEEIFVPDATTALQLFENGELSYISLNSEGFQKFGEDPRVKSYNSTAVTYWAMNLANEEKTILDNVNFRLALFHAVDRATIAKTINCTPADYYLSPELMGDLENGIRYRDTPQGQSVQTENYGFNPDLAREYFAKALEETGMTEKIVLEIKASETSDARKETAEQLQQMVPKILGEDKIEFVISQLPNKVVANQMRARDYETGLGGYTYSSLRPWGTMQIFASDYGGNVVDESGNVTLYGKRKHTPWYNDEYDAGWQELMFGETQFDTQARLDLMAELESLVLSEAPAIPIYCHQKNVIYSSDVELQMKQYAPQVEFGHAFSRPKNK